MCAAVRDALPHNLSALSTHYIQQIILSRKSEVRRLEEEGEEGMVHSLLSSLPDMYEDEVPSDPDKLSKPPTNEEAALPDDTLPVVGNGAVDMVTSPLEMDTDLPNLSSLKLDSSRQEDTLVQSEPGSPPEIPEKDAPEPSELNLCQEALGIDSSVTEASTPEKPVQRRRLSDASETKPTKPVPISLPNILIAADELLELYPATNPAIQLSALLGPNSVVFERPVSAEEAEWIAKSGESVIGTTWVDSDVEEEDDDLGNEKERKQVHRRRQQETAIWIAGAVLVFAMSLYAAQGQQGKDWKLLGGVVIGAGEGLGLWQ